MQPGRRGKSSVFTLPLDKQSSLTLKKTPKNNENLPVLYFRAVRLCNASTHVFSRDTLPFPFALDKQQLSFFLSFWWKPQLWGWLCYSEAELLTALTILFIGSNQTNLTGPSCTQSLLLNSVYVTFEVDLAFTRLHHLLRWRQQKLLLFTEKGKKRSFTHPSLPLLWL